MGLNIKRAVTEALELPVEAVLNLPVLTMTGREELSVENYRSIIEYSEESIKISTGCGSLRITGEKLLLKQLTSEHIVVSGSIFSLEFLR